MLLIFKQKGEIMKLKTWLNFWLEHNAKLRVSPRTLEKYRQAVDLHINPCIGEIDLDNLSQNVLQCFVNKQKCCGKKLNKASLANNTVASTTTVLKQALPLAVKFEFAKKENISKIKTPPHTQKEPQTFNRQESQKLLDFCCESINPNHIGFAICLCCGLGAGELLALEWKDVNFETGTLNLKRRVFQLQSGQTIVQTLNWPSPRKVNVPLKLLKCLKQLKCLARGKTIISTSNGKIVTESSYRRTYKGVLKNLNIPHRSFGSLRQTFIVQALQSDMELETLAQILGYKETRALKEKYIHYIPKNKKIKTCQKKSFIKNFKNKIKKYLFFK